MDGAEESAKLTSSSEIFENANLPRVRNLILTFCVFSIVCWTLVHVFVYYGLYGLVIATILFFVTCYLAEENVSHERLVFGARFLIVGCALLATLYYYGLAMLPTTILQIASFVAIEYLFKFSQESKERMERVECDVCYLFDENAAEDYGQDEEEEIRQAVLPVKNTVGALRNSIRKQ